MKCVRDFCQLRTKEIDSINSMDISPLQIFKGTWQGVSELKRYGGHKLRSGRRCIDLISLQVIYSIPSPKSLHSHEVGLERNVCVHFLFR
jgi:hypothetical protein